MKWLQFPEALYLAFFNAIDGPSIAGSTRSLAFDASSFADVENFCFMVDSKKWEVSTIEKTYAYGKMMGGDEGERIDFQLHPDLKQIDTFNPPEGSEDMSWAEIIDSKLAINDEDRYSKKV